MTAQPSLTNSAPERGQSTTPIAACGLPRIDLDGAEKLLTLEISGAPRMRIFRFDRWSTRWLSEKIVDAYAYVLIGVMLPVRWRCSPRTLIFRCIWTPAIRHPPSTFRGVLRSLRCSTNSTCTRSHALQRSRHAVLDGEHAAGVATAWLTTSRSRVQSAVYDRGDPYLDMFVKDDGIWYFNQCKLTVDWTETRAIKTVSNSADGVTMRPDATIRRQGLTICSAAKGMRHQRSHATTHIKDVTNNDTGHHLCHRRGDPAATSCKRSEILVSPTPGPGQIQVEVRALPIHRGQRGSASFGRPHPGHRTVPGLEATWSRGRVRTRRLSTP